MDSFSSMAIRTVQVSKQYRVGIIGTGAAGLGLAAMILDAGHRVRIWARPGPRFDRLRDSGSISISHSSRFERELPVEVTGEGAELVRNSDVLVVAVNSDAQAELLKSLGDAMTSDHLVILVPGHTGGAWAAAAARLRAELDVPRIAETPLPFVARQHGVNSVDILQKKNQVVASALGAEIERSVFKVLSELSFPVSKMVSPLEAGLRNTTAVVQPPLILGNLVRIDRAEPFRIYREGLSPALGRVIQEVDHERRSIARAFGFNVPTVGEWLQESYGAVGPTVSEQVQNVPGYADILAPGSVNHRFLGEHVRSGLVPLAALGRMANVSVPTISAAIELASVVLDEDLAASGRSLDALVPPTVSEEHFLNRARENQAIDGAGAGPQ